MVTQREMNSAKRQLNTLVNDAIELLNESKSMEINEMNTGILLVCRESIEEELENYKKQLNGFINTLETENEENDKLLENYENTTMNGKITLNKLNRVIMGFQQQREKQLELEERIRKEKYEYEQERYEQELQLKKTEMELALREKLEIEKLQIEKMKLQNEKELKSTEIEVRTKENTQRADSQHPTNIATVKLPKLMLAKFDGNLLHWQEFWDSFETTIHNNTSLQDVDKLNYLRAQLRSEAKDVIAGLEITNASYAVAVDLLKERYNNKQLMIDAHYSQLRDIPTTTTYYEKLRSTFDQLERHLRSLEALGQDIENEFMVSLIRSKLPKLILAKLEEYKDANDIWTVQNLRKELKKYIATQELGDRLTKMNRSKLDFDRKHEDNGTYRQNQRYIHSSGNQSTGAFAVGETIRKTCVYCGKSHWSDECTEYPDLQSRKIKAKGHCFICLRKGHQLKECNSTRPCAYCKKKGNHHRSLCPNHFPTSQSELSSATLELKETNLVAAEERVIMQTALIELTDVKNVEDDVKQSARVLLDSGSQRTYISEDIANKLKLIPIDKNFLTIYTFGTTKPKCIETPVVEVKMVLKSGFTMKIKANVVPNVTGTIERRPINSKAMKETLKQYELADTLPVKAENCNIDLLIGNDYFADIVSMKRILLSDGLYLLGSKFGWILSGRKRNDNSIPKEYSLAMFTHSSSDISTNLLGFEKTDDCVFKQSRIEDFWALETIGIKDDSTITDDDKAISEFNKSIHLVNDRYQVRWPWREDNPTLPDNYKLSYGRLVSTMKRLKEDHETLKKYNDIIEDQIKKGIIEKIDNNTVQGEIKHYIPHHGVLKPSNRTTKLRGVVYDASAKAKKTNLSLNECLYRGPVILEDLCSLLLRFRTHETAIVADIEKAFLQINLREEDRDVTRFLWLKDINKPVTPENIDVFRFARIPFGVISSRFILAATINYNLR